MRHCISAVNIRINKNMLLQKKEKRRDNSYAIVTQMS